MLVLFDHGTPAPIRSFLEGHVVTRTQDLGWDRLTNGELLEAAEANGFDLLLTTDKNIQYQQNLTDRKIAIIVIGNAQCSVLLTLVVLRSGVDDLFCRLPFSEADHEKRWSTLLTP
jgi:hypothetical protein